MIGLRRLLLGLLALTAAVQAALPPTASANTTRTSNSTLPGATPATAVQLPGATLAPNVSVLAAAAATAEPQAPISGRLMHNGQELFLIGVNLGNVQFLPFEGNPYGYSVAQMQALLDGALAELVSRHWRLYKLLSRRSANATLGKNGGSYVGWYFLQEDGTFNNFLYHDTFDNYPSEWDFLKESIVDRRDLATVEVPYMKVLRFINRVAGAIHRAVPGAKVTIGAHSMPYVTNLPMPSLFYDNAPLDSYSDQMLVTAGGDPLGTLDFYAVHGYAIWNEPARDRTINMFLHPKAHWQVDKPILVGEHWEQVMANPSTVTVQDYVHLHDSGYAGGWGWAWFNVTETYNYATGANPRGIGEHKCRGTLRQLLAALPQRCKYPPVHRAATPAPAAVIG